MYACTKELRVVIKTFISTKIVDAYCLAQIIKKKNHRHTSILHKSISRGH